MYSQGSDYCSAVHELSGVLMQSPVQIAGLDNAQSTAHSMHGQALQLPVSVKYHHVQSLIEAAGIPVGSVPAQVQSLGIRQLQATSWLLLPSSQQASKWLHTKGTELHVTSILF